MQPAAPTVTPTTLVSTRMNPSKDLILSYVEPVFMKALVKGVTLGQVVCS